MILKADNFFVLQTIDKVMQIENDFFPLISGELGDTLEQTNQLQARLDQFVPIYQVLSFDVHILIKPAFLFTKIKSQNKRAFYLLNF